MADPVEQIADEVYGSGSDTVAKVADEVYGSDHPVVDKVAKDIYPDTDFIDKASQVMETPTAQTIAGEHGYLSKMMDIPMAPIRFATTLFAQPFVKHNPDDSPLDQIGNAFSRSAINATPAWAGGTPDKTPPIDQVMDQYGLAPFEKIGDILKAGQQAPEGQTMDAMYQRGQLLKGTDVHGTYSEWQHPDGWQQGDFAPKPITMFQRESPDDTERSKLPWVGAAFGDPYSITKLGMDALRTSKYDPKGTDAGVSVPGFVGQTLNFIAGFLAQGKVPGFRLGISKEGQAAQAAKSQSMYDQSLKGRTTPEVPVNPAQVQAERLGQEGARIPLHEQVAAGNVGIDLPEAPSLRGGGPRFLAVPKSLAPLFKTLSGPGGVIENLFLKPILGEDPREAFPTMGYASKGVNRAAVKEFTRQYIEPLDKINQNVSPENLPLEAKLFSPGDNFDREGNLNTAEAPILSERFSQHLSDEQRAAAQAGHLEGWSGRTRDFNEARVKVSTLPEPEQAAIWAAVEYQKKLPQFERDFMKANGVKMPNLNDDIKQYPYQLADAMDAIDTSKASGGANAAELPAAIKNLAKQAERAPLNPKDMQTLVDELQGRANNSKISNSMTADAELDALKETLKGHLPLALKQSNAVSVYTPGAISLAVRNAYTNNNGFLTKLPEAQAPREKGTLLRDEGKQFEDMGNVKASEPEAERRLRMGTAATNGEAAAYQQKGGLWKSFLTEIGYQKYKDDAAQTFRETDPGKAWRRKLQQDYLALDSATMTNAVKQNYTSRQQGSVARIQKAMYDGVDSGELQAPKGNPEGEPVPVMRPATLEDLQKIWTDSGEKSAFMDNLDPGTARDLAAGKIPLNEAITQNWQPFGRTLMEFNDGSQGYVHSEVVKKLNDYKQLGSDPSQIVKWLRLNAPWYVYFTQNQKKWSTLYGPQVVGYVNMKLGHDLARTLIGDLTDGLTAGEVARGMESHINYAQTGAIDGTMAYNLGQRGMMAFPDMMRELETLRLADHGEAATEFQPLKAKPTNMAGKLGQTAENLVRGQDNAVRAAAYAKLQREGLSPYESALRVQNALFDFTQTGPVTHAVSQSGVVPFATWTTKVVPFMLKWAMQKPGEFALVLDALRRVGANQIPASQLPQYLQDKTNIQWGPPTKDKDGHLQLNIISDTGVIPTDDLMHIARSFDNNGMREFFKGKLGPVLRFMLQQNDQMAYDAKNPDRITADERLASGVKSALGRPAMVAQTLADPRKSTGEKALSLVNPMSFSQVDVTKAGAISGGTMEKAVKSAAYAEAAAEKDVKDQLAVLRQANIKMAEADLLKLADDDPIYTDAIQRVLKEKAALTRLQAKQRQTAAERLKMQKLSAMVNLTH